VPKKRKKDLALVYGPADDGEGFKVLRKRVQSDNLETGVIRPLKQGRAIHGEVVQMKQRPESPLVFDMETDAELSSPPPNDSVRESRDGGRNGPAQVATDKYRQGWDGIWGSRRLPSPTN